MILKNHQFAFLCMVISFANFCNGVIVEIENGLIEGQTEYTSPNGKVYNSFRSIPYAKPPLGELRFMAPQPVDSWDGVLPTKTDSPRCVQTKNKQLVGQEDCLYLNVYTPQTFNSTNYLPVMVWIYGGGFITGTSEYADAAPDYFLDQDIVFVSMNYRVGVLGFMTLNDIIAPGNSGLKDQNLALRWVKNNIHNFGGDPNHVTLMGQSAGAASVAYHLQSPLSEDLFSGAILESGNSFCLWAFSRIGAEAAMKIAANFSIDINDTRAVLSGLQKVEVEDLQKISTDIQNQLLISTNPRDGFIFAPVKEPNHEGAFFSGMSHELLRKGKFERVPILLGHNSMEAIYTFPDVVRLYLLKYDKDPSNLVPFDMNIHSSVVKNSAGEEVKLQYFGLTPIALSNQQLIEFISDDQFVRPFQQFARLLSKYTTTYFYEFRYEGLSGGIVNRTMSGVAHSEELGYLFRRNITQNKFDQLMTKRMVKMWTNFVKYRNPTPESEDLLQNQIWPPVSPDSKDIDYFIIDRNLTTSNNVKNEIINFWTNLYDRYGQPPYDTY